MIPQKSRIVEQKTANGLDLEKYSKIYTNGTGDKDETRTRQSYNRYKSRQPERTSYGTLDALNEDTRNMVLSYTGEKTRTLNKSFHNKREQVADELCDSRITGRELMRSLTKESFEDRSPGDVICYCKFKDIISKNSFYFVKYFSKMGKVSSIKVYKYEINEQGFATVTIEEDKEPDPIQPNEEYVVSIFLLDDILEKRLSCVNKFEKYASTQTEKLTIQETDLVAKNIGLSYDILQNEPIPDDNKIEINGLSPDYDVLAQRFFERDDSVQSYKYPFDSFKNMKQYWNGLLRILVLYCVEGVLNSEKMFKENIENDNEYFAERQPGDLTLTTPYNLTEDESESLGPITRNEWDLFVSKLQNLNQQVRDGIIEGDLI